jgi:hypothetical protein
MTSFWGEVCLIVDALGHQVTDTPGLGTHSLVWILLAMQGGRAHHSAEVKQSDA